MSLVKKIISCAAALMTVIGGALPVNAANTPVAGTKVSFDVYMIMPKGANVPDAAYKYIIAPSDGHSADKEKGTMEVKKGIGTPALTSVGADGTEVQNMAYFWLGQTTYDTVQSDGTDNTGAAFADSVTLKDSEKYAVTPVSVDFSGIEFEEPGIYRYKIDEAVDENAGTNEYAAITSDANSSRYLDVWVSSDDGGKLSVTGSVLHTENDDVKSGTNPAGKNTGYVHRYTTHDLTVSKTVTGNQGSKDKYFEFTVSISNANPGTKYDVDLSNADATTTINGASTEVKTNPAQIVVGDDGTVTQTFWLKHGQSVIVKGIADKSTAEVSEADYKNEGYSASYNTGVTSQLKRGVVLSVVPTSDVTVKSVDSKLDITMAPAKTMKFSLTDESEPFDGTVTTDNSAVAAAEYDAETGKGTVKSLQGGSTSAKVSDAGGEEIGSATINVSKEDTMFDTGKNVNAVLDTLGAKDENANLTFAKSVSAPSSDITTHDVSADHDNSIVMWKDEDTVKWYSPYKNVYMNPDAASMFGNCASFVAIDTAGINTSKAKSMTGLFGGCAKLTSLDLSGFNTSSVTDTAVMFEQCHSLVSLNVANFDTSSVTDMEQMFQECRSLKSLDVSNFNTSNVTDMALMFDQCYALPSIDVSHFDTSKVTEMSDMFADCTSLTSLDVSNFNTGNVTDMSNMFWACNNMESLSFSDKFDTSKVTDMSGMFSVCSSLSALYLPDSFSTKNVTNRKDMMVGLNSLELLSLPKGFSFNGNNVLEHENWKQKGTWKEYPNGGDAMTAEELCRNYDGSGKVYVRTLTTKSAAPQTISTSVFKNKFGRYSYNGFSRSDTTPGENADDVTDISETQDGSIVAWYVPDTEELKWYSKFDKVYLGKDCSKMFAGPNIDNIDLTGMDASKALYMKDMFASNESGKIVIPKGFHSSHVIDMSGMFSTSGRSIEGLENLDTSNVIDMHDMFKQSALASIDLSGLDTSKVRNMSGMFYYCQNLTSLNISNLKTGNVTDMNSMFESDGEIVSLDLSNFNTSNVTDMHNMFYYCDKLEKIVFPEDIDTSKVTNMNSMFYKCMALTSLDVSNFDTSNVTDMGSMFFLSEIEGSYWNYSSLTTLDVSGFDTSKVTNMTDMFSGCDKVKYLDLSNFDLSKVTGDTSYMLYHCEGMETIKLGPKCKGDLPIDGSASGTWKASDASMSNFGKTYGEGELSSKWNGSTMAGTYTRVHE